MYCEGCVGKWFSLCQIYCEGCVEKWFGLCQIYCEGCVDKGLMSNILWRLRQRVF